MSQGEFLDCLHRLVFYIGFAIVGVLMLVGAYRRWRWLVDPPLSWSPYYSQAMLKEMMGPTAVLYFTYDSPSSRRWLFYNLSGDSMVSSNFAPASALDTPFKLVSVYEAFHSRTTLSPRYRSIGSKSRSAWSS